jgi:taurine transport system permease protein
MMKRSDIGEKIYFILPFISLGTVGVLWIVMSASHPDLIPSPMDILQRYKTLIVTPIGKVTLFDHIWASIQRVLIGFFAASTLGIILGLCMGWSKRIHAFVGPVFELLRPIPPIAWIPVVILWFGIGEEPKVFIVFVGAFVPVVINTFTGVKMLDPLFISAAKAFGATQRQMITEVVLPGVLPPIFAGLKNGLSNAWMCVLAAEMVGARLGVGYLIMNGMDSGNTAQIICCMIIIGVVGAFISVGLSSLERRVCPWVIKQ